MDETQVAFVAAIAAVLASGIGAGGAILAQFLTVRATDKASAKRFEWEQKQAVRREMAEREAIFADAKLVLFARYMALHNEFRNDLVEAYGPGATDRAAMFRDAFSRFVAEVRHVQAEIALIAPSLAEETATLLTNAGRVYKKLESRSTDEAAPDYVSPWKDLYTYRDSIRACRTSMSDHLYGDRPSGELADASWSGGSASK